MMVYEIRIFKKIEYAQTKGLFKDLNYSKYKSKLPPKIFQ